MLIVVGNGELVTFDLPHGDVVIGRGEDCDVVVDHRALSRRHAILRLGPPATVEDLGSTNGTRVSGALHRGGGPIALHAGETFHVGPIAFVIVRREARTATTSSGELGDLLQVVDPSTEGATPLVRDIARSGANVLILGETGVGKELLASTIHALSERPGAMTRINCAALSESLLESELFGHEKGSFTGAATQKTGLIEAADRGTVFLDEIGELPPASQAKLLRVVEQREVLRLGATRPTALDVRFVAATNRDLLADVEAGAFRRDLFFRLDGVELSIPPLRARRGQIGAMAVRFLENARVRAAKPELRLDRDAVAALEAHPWPGNVRELKAVIERAVLLATGDQIGVRHLVFARRGRTAATAAVAAPPAVVPATGVPSAPAPLTIAPPLRAPPAGASLAQGRMPDDVSDEHRADRDRLLRALDDCAGNQTRAAKQLGISRTTLVTKLQRYRIPRPRA